MAAASVKVKIELDLSPSGMFIISENARSSIKIASTVKFEKGSVRIHRITIEGGPRTYLIQHLSIYARFKNGREALSAPSNITGRLKLAFITGLFIYTLIITVVLLAL